MTSPLLGIALPIGRAVPAADLVGLAVRAEAAALDVVEADPARLGSLTEAP